jgi:muramoyltetrapeptide carboxypeptidase
VLTDPGIAGVIFAKGGYGAQRTLEVLDWDALTAAGLAPKVLAGYSDVTAVLEAVAVRLGWASLFAPMPSVPGAAAHYSFGSLLRVLTRPADATRVRYPDAVTITGGRTRGVTMGGTLTMLSSSLGTPASWPARGGILLLEDVEEEPYRLDRMLTQLRRSGYLDGVAGIIAGTFTDCGPREEVQEVLTERLGDLGVPMIAWANVGHGGKFQTYPIGVAAELDTATATLRLLDPPLLPGLYGSPERRPTHEDSRLSQRGQAACTDLRPDHRARADRPDEHQARALCTRRRLPSCDLPACLGHGGPPRCRAAA